MCMTRLVVESGWRMTGGAAQVGSVGSTVASRSWTTCRAWIRSVPRSKIISTDESCGTDAERISSRRATPLSACSSGTVTSSSVSSEESPTQMVWTSTRGGANSGKASDAGVAHLAGAEDHHAPSAAATTRKRNLRLEPMIQRMADAVASSVLFDLVLAAVQLLRADGHHRRPDRRPARTGPPGAVDALDA